MNGSSNSQGFKKAANIFIGNVNRATVMSYACRCSATDVRELKEKKTRLREGRHPFSHTRDDSWDYFSLSEAGKGEKKKADGTTQKRRPMVTGFSCSSSIFTLSL